MFGLDFGKKHTIALFVDVALRAASILETNDIPFCGRCPARGLDFEKYSFLYLIIIVQVTKLVYFDGFEHRECLRTLSFEKCCRLH